MLNKTILQGRLVADPELRHTASGVAAATFRLAVDRDFKNKETGERSADFLSIVAWRQTAVFVEKYLSKGRMVIVEGKLQSRTYDDQEGNRRYITEVVADNVYFADSKRDDSAPAPVQDYASEVMSTYGITPPPEGPGDYAMLEEDDGQLPF